MYRWEFNDPLVRAAFDALPKEAADALLEFMDAVLFDPMEYGRTPDEPAGRPVRSLAFGRAGLVTIQVYEPDRLVLVLKVQWAGLR